MTTYRTSWWRMYMLQGRFGAAVALNVSPAAVGILARRLPSRRQPPDNVLGQRVLGASRERSAATLGRRRAGAGTRMESLADLATPERGPTCPTSPATPSPSPRRLRRADPRKGLAAVEFTGGPDF
jgi:hypothetical protein